MDISKYIDENKERILEELFGLIRIPSVSSKSEHKPDMYKACEYWKKIFLEAGCDKAEVMETDGNPVTYGEKIIDENLPTVLVYGHTDVMPVEPLNLWKSEPFEPEIRDGKIFARGADDDKGQAFMHAKAFEYMIKTNTLPCNVKFIIEGEEEIGSPSLKKFLEKNKELLKTDVILVSDTGMIGADIPSITVGLRGLSFMQIEMTGPDKDLHSGLYGGAIANPVNVLTKVLSQLTDENGRILIEGFYDDVLEATDEERKKMNEAPFDEEEYKNNIGVKKLFGEKGFTTIEHTGIRPTVDINGIWGGYTGEGAKTIIPSKAYAKVSMRLVPNQENNKIAELFKKYILKITPDTVDVKVDFLHGGQGYVSPIDIPEYKAAEKAVEEVFGKKVIPVRSGGSIPIVAVFEEVLEAKTILMGFGLETDVIHSPNENFPLDMFFKGIKSIPLFYKYYIEFLNS